MGAEGAFEATGQVPSFYEALRAAGAELDYSIFRRAPLSGESEPCRH